MRSSLIAMLVVFCVSAAACGGQEPAAYVLRLQDQVGQKWQFEQTQETRQSVAMTAPGMPAQQMQQSGSGVRRGTAEVLQVRDGVASQTKITFDRACAVTARGPQGEQTTPFALAGSTVTLSLTADGELRVEPRLSLDAATQQELRGFIEPNRALYPDRPVQVGQEWDGQAAGLRRMLGLPDDAQAAARCKLAAIEAVDGRDAAKVDATITSRAEQAGLTFDNRSKAAVWMDLATGRVLRVELTGQITARGQQPMPTPDGQRVNVQLDGTTQLTLRGHLKSLGGPAGAPQPAQAPRPADAPARQSPEASARRQPAPAPDAAGGKVMKFRRVSVRDRDDMIGGEAVSFLAPSDWDVQAQVVWRQHPVMPASFAARITNPAGLEQIESFPTMTFSWGGPFLGPGTAFPIGSNYLGNEVCPPPRDFAQFITELLLPRSRQGLRYNLVTAEPLPELARAVKAQNPDVGNVTTQVSAGRVRIGYAADAGAVEEDFYCALIVTRVPAGTHDTVIWLGERLLAMRAARGKLDEQDAMLQTMISSSRVNVQWFNRYAQLCQALTKAQMDRIKAAGEMSRIISRTHSEISDMMMRSYEERQASEDRISKNFSQYIRGVDEYHDPVQDRPVELPSGYNHAWVNRGGEYIVTDNPNYNPNVETQGDWTELKRTGE